MKNVRAGIIGATAQQYPLKMASLGHQGDREFAKTGEKPQASKGLDFFNTGTNLITADPQKGVPSISVEEGSQDLCWG